MPCIYMINCGFCSFDFLSIFIYSLSETKLYKTHNDVFAYIVRHLFKYHCPTLYARSIAIFGVLILVCLYISNTGSKIYLPHEFLYVRTVSLHKQVLQVHCSSSLLRSLLFLTFFVKIYLTDSILFSVSET